MTSSSGSPRHPYARSLADLEDGVRVPREHRTETAATAVHREHLAAEELDRLRLLADPAGAGTLSPRR